MRPILLAAAAALTLPGAALACEAHEAAYSAAPHETGHAHGGHAPSDTLTVANAWVKPPMPGRDVTAAYFTVANGLADGDRLIAASAPFAETVELHTHLNDDGVMRMRKVDALEAPAGAQLTLQPGGDHLMLFGVDPSKIGEGMAAPITLTFENAGDVVVMAKVADRTRELLHGDAHHH